MSRVCGTPTQPSPEDGGGLYLAPSPVFGGGLGWGCRAKNASGQSCSKKFELLVLTARINFNP
jgi:hypothetical protein